MTDHRDTPFVDVLTRSHSLMPDPSTLSVSTPMVGFISSWEGYEPEWYLDGGGVKTIGYGVTAPALRGVGIDPAELDVPLHRDEAEHLLYVLLQHIYEPAVTKSLDVGVRQFQYDALVSLAYNIGAGAFVTSTLLQKINAKAPKPEIEQQWMRWVHDNGEVVRGLVRRRKAEFEWYGGFPNSARTYGYERVDVPQIDPAEPAEVETLDVNGLPHV